LAKDIPDLKEEGHLLSLMEFDMDKENPAAQNESSGSEETSDSSETSSQSS